MDLTTPSLIVKPNVFLYQDYLSFLRDSVAYMKAHNSKWSYAFWAKRIGVTNRSSLLMIVSGHRKPTDSMLEKIGQGLQLNLEELVYLKDLVQLHKISVDSTLKISLLNVSKQSRLNSTTNVWLVLAISEILSVKCTFLTVQQIQKVFLPNVDLKEIEVAFAILFDQGIILKSRNGQISIQKEHLQKWISTVVQKADLVDMQASGAKAAAYALENLPTDQRVLRSSFVKVSKENYVKAEQILFEAQRQLSNLSDFSVGACEVFQLQIQLFPITQISKTNI